MALVYRYAGILAVDVIVFFRSPGVFHSQDSFPSMFRPRLWETSSGVVTVVVVAAEARRELWACPSRWTLHFATQHASNGVHMPIAVWSFGGLWTMEADAMACEPLVQPSKDGDELLKQTGSNPLQYSSVDSTLWMNDNLHGPVPAHFCIRPSSLHLFHTRITVIAACPVQAAMSRYDKPASWRPTILPHSNALTCWYCTLCVDEAYLH